MDNVKFTQAYLWKDTHKRLKIASEIKGLTMADIVDTALQWYEQELRIGREIDKRIDRNREFRG